MPTGGAAQDPIVRLRDSEVYGPRIQQDADAFAKKEAVSPRSEAEALEDSAKVHGGLSFFSRYCQPMIDTIVYVEDNLGDDWGIVVHLGRSLAWLAPKLLSAGDNVEVSVMAVDGIRTAGSMWRWLPFDDRRFETVLALDADQTPRHGAAFKLWPAVEAFARGDRESRTSTTSLMRWYRGWADIVRKNAHIGGGRW